MCRVLNEYDQSSWVPGIIQIIDHSSYQKTFCVLYFNGQEGLNVRSELIKINREMYGQITNYIKAILGLKPDFDQQQKRERVKSTKEETNISLTSEQIRVDIMESVNYQIQNCKF
jgi:hypothetical protein